MDSSASVHVSGATSAAARKSPALNECVLRLPEIPTIVTIITSFGLHNESVLVNVIKIGTQISTEEH